MRTILATVALCALSGCYTETRVTRTVTRPDGSSEVYENHSNGYNYNPNWTGHSENTFIGHTYNVAPLAEPSPFITSRPDPAFGQHTIR